MNRFCLLKVELNKALLREIGKRSSNLYDGSEYPLGYTYYDRKLYNQRVASKPNHGSPAEDELEAMVENLLHSNHLAASKLQRTRSINERHAPASRMAADPEAQAAQSSQQLSSLLNNEREDLKTKDQALRQSDVSVAQEQDNTNDNGEDDDQEEQPFIDGSTSVLKPAQGGNDLLEPSNNPSSSDQQSGTEYGPRYVYGMYKNRYAN
uniref:Uncharacterized protein n=1 Tax=Anopheles minimus TaxID=112268 RepID=A0A182VQP0_9DIPT